MIEILKKSDVKKVNDPKFREYLEYSFNRLPENYEYPEFGYFVIIESLDELIANEINLTTYVLNGLENGLYDDINMVEVKDKIMEILVFVDNDISVSLILAIEILEDRYKEELEMYII